MCFIEIAGDYRTPAHKTQHQLSCYLVLHVLNSRPKEKSTKASNQICASEKGMPFVCGSSELPLCAARCGRKSSLSCRFDN